MSRSTTDYLRHILDEATYLATSVKALDKTTFLTDETLKRAFVRSWKSSERPSASYLPKRAIRIRRSRGEPLPACATD